MARKYEKYKPEFRDEVARLVVETTRSIADVSREYGLNETTVGGWVKKYRATHAADEGRRWNYPNAPGCGNSNAATANSKWRMHS